MPWDAAIGRRRLSQLTLTGLPEIVIGTEKPYQLVPETLTGTPRFYLAVFPNGSFSLGSSGIFADETTLIAVLQKLRTGRGRARRDLGESHGLVPTRFRRARDGLVRGFSVGSLRASFP